MLVCYDRLLQKNGEITAGHYCIVIYFHDQCDRTHETPAKYSIQFHAFDFMDFTTKAQTLKYTMLEKYLIQPWPHSVRKFRRIPF